MWSLRKLSCVICYVVKSQETFLRLMLWSLSKVSCDFMLHSRQFPETSLCCRSLRKVSCVICYIVADHSGHFPETSHLLLLWSHSGTVSWASQCRSLRTVSCVICYIVEDLRKVSARLHKSAGHFPETSQCSKSQDTCPVWSAMLWSLRKVSETYIVKPQESVLCDLLHCEVSEKVSCVICYVVKSSGKLSCVICYVVKSQESVHLHCEVSEK